MPRGFRSEENPVYRDDGFLYHSEDEFKEYLAMMQDYDDNEIESLNLSIVC